MIITYLVLRKIDKIKNVLAKDFRIVSKWIYENFIVLNSNKCHFMCIGRDGVSQIFAFKMHVIKAARNKLLWRKLLITN